MKVFFISLMRASLLALHLASCKSKAEGGSEEEEEEAGAPVVVAVLLCGRLRREGNRGCTVIAVREARSRAPRATDGGSASMAGSEEANEAADESVNAAAAALGCLGKGSGAGAGAGARAAASMAAAALLLLLLLFAFVAPPPPLRAGMLAAINLLADDDGAGAGAALLILVLLTPVERGRALKVTAGLWAQ